MIIKACPVLFTHTLGARAHTVSAFYHAHDVPHVNTVEKRSEITRPVAFDFSRNLYRRILLFKVDFDVRTVLVVL